MIFGITLPIIIITVLFSVQALNNFNVMDKFILNPYRTKANKEWYRLITSGFLHADWMHLGINMYVLYSCGSVVENRYMDVFGSKGKLLFILLYLSSIVAANASTYFKEQNNPNYQTLGASGAVSALLFVSVLFYPFASFGIVFIPFLRVPGFVFAILYLVYSQYAARKNYGNINHDAHFYGAIYGVVFTLVFKPELFKYFLSQF